MASRLKGRFVKKTVKDQIQKSTERIQKYNNKCNETGDHMMELESENTNPWQGGKRRIIEPLELVRQLKKGCEDCGKIILFTNIMSETRSGLGSLYYTMCECGCINKLYSRKIHYDQSKLYKTRPIFDVNSKAAIAMYDNGMGTHKVNRFLTDMNIPGIAPTAMTKREREVSGSIKKVAEYSLDRSLEEEKKMSLSVLESPHQEKVPIQIKYDMGWQKRGSGRKYDSRSGVGVAIGNKTGKVLEMEARSKDCRTCTYWEGKSMEPPIHQCSRNWFGTSEGMEPDAGVSLIKKLEEKNCQVSTLIMDDDATTMARVRQNIDHDIEK